MTRIIASQHSNREILEKVFRYLQYYPKDLLRILYFLFRYRLTQFSNNTNRTYIEGIYKYFLGKEISETEVDFFLRCLEKGEANRITLLFSFLMIPGKLEQKFFHTQGIFSHHQARLQLVENKLPPADFILDLGGALEGIPSGSLLHMGYPYQPKRIDIVDLPHDERFVKCSSPDELTQYSTPQGTQIFYHYVSMTNLSFFENASFDLVWAGQSIEHITPEEANCVIQEVYRVLKPGASFCLDTPNRQLTRLQVRQGFVHPEHKVEYVPDELIKRLLDVGFVLIEQCAVSPMPISWRIGCFNRLELIHSTSLGDNPDNGYSFYLQVQKPLSPS